VTTTDVANRTLPRTVSWRPEIRRRELSSHGWLPWKQKRDDGGMLRSQAERKNMLHESDGPCRILSVYARVEHPRPHWDLGW